MPKVPKPKLPRQSAPKSSTESRLQLASFIDIFGDIMPVACARCRTKGLVCRVHVHSGRCNECNRSNADNCDIRISEEEWGIIRTEREQLQERLAAIQREAVEIGEALQRNAVRAAEMISVEESNIQRLEREEAAASSKGQLALSPFTWSVQDGMTDDFWEATAPTFLGEPVGGTAPTSGGSS
jgi:hypothetical protein